MRNVHVCKKKASWKKKCETIIKSKKNIVLQWKYKLSLKCNADKVVNDINSNWWGNSIQSIYLIKRIDRMKFLDVKKLSFADFHIISNLLYFDLLPLYSSSLSISALHYIPIIHFSSHLLHIIVWQTK